VAGFKNASSMLFAAAKVSHRNLLPEGKAEKDRRVLNMVWQMDQEGFGYCTGTGSCEAVCPKEISLSSIAKINRDYGVARWCPKLPVKTDRAQTPFAPVKQKAMDIHETPTPEPDPRRTVPHPRHQTSTALRGPSSCENDSPAN
jgi:ferredoxin